MTKAEFIERLEGHFQLIINSTKRQASAEIEDRLFTSDGKSFSDWLRSEMEKANAEPARITFRKTMIKGYSTPEDAARSFADFIEIDLCDYFNDAKQLVSDPSRVNWKEQFQSATPLLTNYHPEKAEGWKYSGEFRLYIKAVKAEARALVFASFGPNRGMTEILPLIREEYEKVKNRPYLVKDRNQKGNGFAALLADILTEAKQKIASGNASFLSNEDTEMILHFADLVSAEMRALVQATKDGFDRQKIALEAHLRQNGYIVPADFEEFADWFFGVKFHGANLQKLVSEAKVKEEHFAEFSKWKEGRLTGHHKITFTKAALTAPADLSSIEDALNDVSVLPKIWTLCAAEKYPAFDVKGNFIWGIEKTKHSVLYAFAASMRSKVMLKKKIETKAFYIVLCRKYEMRPASKISNLPKTTAFEDAKGIFDDILREI